MNNLFKYTDPSWHEVLTEQIEKNSVCSGNSRKEKMINYLREKYSWLKFYESDSLKNLYRQEFLYLSNYNHKIIKKFLNMEKFGHPKKCPAMKNITNLIIF